jgi:hypothetical protein
MAHSCEPNPFVSCEHQGAEEVPDPSAPEQTRLNEEKVAKLLINRTDGETNETFIVSKFS